MKHFLLSALLIAAIAPFSSQAQLKLPSLSPTTKISQDFSTSTIELTYSRPSARGRKVFGDVVAFGNPWRTGANGPTKIKFGEDVEVMGNKVKAGEYVIYSIPDRESWEIIFNTGAGGFSAQGYSRENDVLRFKIKPTRMEGVCQSFTMGFTDLSYNSCKLEIMWERTRLQIPIVALNQDAIQASIDKAIYHPAIPYGQVASYYFESNTKLDLALEYVNKALEQDPKAFYNWYLKARIERKLGHNDKAIEAANKSIETSKGAPLEAEYLHNNTKLINEISKGEFPTDRKTY